MAVKRSELAEAILAILDKGSSQKKTAQAVASYLIENRRSKELHSLLRDLEEIRYKKDGSLEVTAVSATPLTTEAKQKIKSLFDAQQISIHEEINKEVLGGVKVRALDKVADFSVQARLRKLRQGV